MEKAEEVALPSWAVLYERELTADEIGEIEVNISKLAEVLVEIGKSGN